MGWPDTRLTTYIPGELPKAKAADVNSIQDAIGDAWGALFGESRFVAFEDFAGNIALTATGIVPGPGGVQFLVETGAPHLTGISSPPDGTYGAAALSTNDGNATRTDILSGVANLGTRDYHSSSRVAVAKRAGLSVLATAGFSIGNSKTFFKCGSDVGTPNWQAVDSAGTSHDTGVAVVDGTYYRLVIRRVSGVTTFYINGTSVYSAADVVSYTQVRPLYALADIVGSQPATTVVINYDYIRFGPVLVP